MVFLPRLCDINNPIFPARRHFRWKGYLGRSGTTFPGNNSLAVEGKNDHIVIRMLRISRGPSLDSTFHLVDLPGWPLGDPRISDIVQIASRVIVTLFSPGKAQKRKIRSLGIFDVVIPQNEHGTGKRCHELVDPRYLLRPFGIVVSFCPFLILFSPGRLAFEVYVHQGKDSSGSGIREFPYKDRAVMEFVGFPLEPEGSVRSVCRGIIQELDTVFPEKIEILPSSGIVPRVFPPREEFRNEETHGGVALDFLKSQNLRSGISDPLRQGFTVFRRICPFPRDVEILDIEGADGNGLGLKGKNEKKRE